MTATTTDIRFSDLGVPAPMVAVLADQGKQTAFPIQEDTLPDSLQGKDVLGRGRTGSGKTIAFAIPLAARLAASGRKRRAGRPRALVLAPTRELATQIDATLAPLAKAMGLNTTTIFGGVGQGRQVDALRGGVDIVVACPGRLADLMQQGHLTLADIEVTVLDEADHMADMGFLPGVTKIMQATPEQGQRLLFSATLDNGVDKLVKRFLHDPVMHSVDDETSPVEAMTHHLFEVPDADAKKALVRTLASGSGRRILFMRTKHHAKRLAKQLTSQGIPAVDLQGNLSQGARERNLAKFSSGEALVLVATDVAARGVHVDHVELVVHVDPPTEHKAYLHRSGRTARAGSSGDVVTISLPTERRDVAQMMRAAAISVKPQQVTSESPAVTALVGEVAPIRHLAPEQPVQQQRAPKQRSAESDSAGGGRRRGRGGRSGGAGQAGQTAPATASAGSGNRRGGRPADAEAARGGQVTGGRRGGRGADAAASGGQRRGSDAASSGGQRRGSDAASSGGQRRGGSRRASSDVVRGGSAPVWSSEGGYAAGRGAGGESGGSRRRGSRRASRPAGAADRH